MYIVCKYVITYINYIVHIVYNEQINRTLLFLCNVISHDGSPVTQLKSFGSEFTLTLIRFCEFESFELLNIDRYTKSI